MGGRDRKYKYLDESRIASSDWSNLSPHPEHFFFIPKDNENEDEYLGYWSLPSIFESYVSGIQTGRDDFVSAVTKEELDKRILAIKNSHAWSQIAPDIQEPIWDGFSLADFRKAIKSGGEGYLSRWLHRPFDIRTLMYHSSVIKRMRGNIMSSMMKPNIGLCLVRQLSMPTWQHIFAVRTIISDTAISQNSREYNYIFPLYLYDEPKEQITLMGDFSRSLNLSSDFIKSLQNKLGFTIDSNLSSKKAISAEDIIYYAYAVFHSPTYRSRYAEFLKIDFPRLPLTSNVALFRQLCGLGKELVSLHLLESEELGNQVIRFVKGRTSNVAKGYPKYEDGKVYVNEEHYFDGVREDVWNFHIGGYQVCQKWLKDRRERELSAEDIVHYGKVVSALGETIRIMREVDGVIDVNGGWAIK